MIQLATETLKLIDAIHADEQTPSYREHLGASLIGRPCGREIWYSFHWVTAPKHEARILRLFGRGHLEEPRFIAWLRQSGVTVTEGPAPGLQYSIVDHDGHFGGSLDGEAVGIIEIPGSIAVLEFKTHSEKSFKKLTDAGVQKAKLEHYVQCQIYMHYRKRAWALYMAICKNTDALYAELVEYDKTVALKYIARARAIIKADEPPPRIDPSPGWWQCRFCDHKDICHFDAIPKVNCRTCTHSTPGAETTWECSYVGKSCGDKYAQLRGCPQHVFNPHIFNVADFSGDGKENYALLTLHDGRVIKQGPKHLTSEQLWNYGTFSETP